MAAFNSMSDNQTSSCFAGNFIPEKKRDGINLFFGNEIFQFEKWVQPMFVAGKNNFIFLTYN